MSLSTLKLRSIVWLPVLSMLLVLAGCGGDSASTTGEAASASLTRTLAGGAAPAVATAAVSGVSVTGLTKISERRVNRTVFEYVFRVTVRNDSGAALSGLAATVTNSAPGTTVIDGAVAVGALDTAASIVPSDTITLQHDRSQPFATDVLNWVFTTETVRPALAFYSETANPLLVTLTPTSGPAVTFFGAKDERGVPQRVEGFYTHTGDGGPEHVVQYAASGKIGKITTPDGSTFELIWKNETEFVVALVTDGGKVQANVALDLNQTALQQKARLDGLTSATRKYSPRANVSIGPIAAPSAVAAAAKAAPNTNLFVDVTSAGKPEPGALVKANIIPANLGPNHPGYNLVLGEYATGQYATTFANFPSAIPIDSFVATCSAVMGFIRDACKFNKPIASYMLSIGCTQVGVAATIAASPAAGALAIALCEKAFLASTVACTLVDNYTPPSAAAACEAIGSVIQLYDADGVLVKLSASKDGRSGSASGQVAGNAPSAHFSIALPAPPCTIQSLTTSPVQPAAYQSYVATVSTTCGASGGTITVAMSGTDGYESGTQCVATDVCRLSVPGAAAGIVDTITATTSSGATRSTALVFR